MNKYILISEDDGVFGEIECERSLCTGDTFRCITESGRSIDFLVENWSSTPGVPYFYLHVREYSFPCVNMKPRKDY